MRNNLQVKQFVILKKKKGLRGSKSYTKMTYHEAASSIENMLSCHAYPPKWGMELTTMDHKAFKYSKTPKRTNKTICSKV